MKDPCSLLPSGTLPDVKFFPVNKTLEWLDGTEDSRERYLKNGGHPLYREHDIQYHFNSKGYRCPEFDTRADLRIVAIGCSYVMGVGLPAKALFQERFSERLRNEISLSTVVWNLGLPGVSNDYITRMLFLAVPCLAPHIVLINFTHADRREYVSIQRRWLTYIPSYNPADRVAREIKGHFDSLNSPFDNDLNLFRNYKAIECLLANRFWLFSTVNSGDFDRIREHVDPERFAGQLHTVDRARDWSHPGPKSQEALAESFWSRFCALGGLSTLNNGIPGLATHIR